MIHFVGAGPGAPDLITVRGLDLIRRADLIVYAGSLVNPQLLDEKKETCRVFDSAHMTLEEVLTVMLEAERAGLETVRLHTGDPSLYGAIREQMDALDEAGAPYDYCPGVSSMMGAAAALRMEYTLPDVSQSVIITRMEGRTPVPEKERIEAMAAHGATMVIFLSAGRLEELSRRLMEGGYAPDTPAALVYRATWEDEKALRCTVETLGQPGREHGIPRTALVIVGDAAGRGAYRRSDLYRPGFATGYRPARPGGPTQTQTQKPRRASLICFSARGEKMALRLAEALREGAGDAGERFDEVNVWCRREGGAENPGVLTADCSARSWAGERFRDSRLIVFVGAAAIAVRCIAPYLEGKDRDPAVLAADEAGQFIIPLLSGHLGGAHDWCRLLAGASGAQPVITTATDLTGAFAPDVFAKQNDLVIDDLTAAKKVAARCAAGGSAGWICRLPETGSRPAQLVDAGDVSAAPGGAVGTAPAENSTGAMDCGILVSARREPAPFACTLRLIPRHVVVGIGCRKGKSAGELEAFVRMALAQEGIDLRAVCAAATIDVKKDEPGLAALCEKMGWTLLSFSAGQLGQVPGEYASSDFVQETVGVDNVCERSAVLGCMEMLTAQAAPDGGVRLLLHKTAGDGMTAAAACYTRRIRFDG